MNFDITTVLAYGVTFGILFMSIIYTFIRYLYSKDFFYISYCCMQLFSLVYILSYSQLFGIGSFVQELALILATVFAISFAISFFSGTFLPKVENQKQLLYYSMLLIFVLATVLYHYILFQYAPYSVIYFLLFISVIFNTKQKVSVTLVYVVGWSLVCLFLYLMQIKNIYTQNGHIDLVLVAFAIEAVLFTISVNNKYNEIENQNLDYENMLLHQSRLAKSGSMIGNIAHQWRQPLNNLSYLLINLNRRYEKGRLDKEYFDKKIEQANEQLQFMSKTIDDFKDFYTPTKTKENFLVEESINKALTILSSEIKQKGVQLKLDFHANELIKVYGIENELSQVVLILVKNAIDALKSKEEPKVNIDVKCSNAEVIIKVCDNGGGIKDINKIFEAYYSTKEDGFGIGLNLAKTIIEKSFSGSIEAKNSKKGAVFTIKIERA